MNNNQVNNNFTNQNNINNNFSNNQNNYNGQNFQTNPCQVNNQTNMNNNSNIYNGQNNYRSQNYSQNPSFYPNNNYNNKKSNRALPIILGVSFVVIAAIVLFIVINKDNSLNFNQNEYEENTNNNNSSNVTNTNTNSAIYTYSGFEISKQSGYDYYTESGMLVIDNSTYMVMLEVLSTDFDYILKNESAFTNELKKQMQSAGFSASNLGVKTISGKKVYAGNLSVSGMNASYFMIDASSNYTFTGMALTSQNTFSDSNISTAISLLENAKYVGGSHNYSNSFDFSANLDFNKLQQGD